MSDFSVVRPGDEVMNAQGDEGLVLSVDCFGQDAIVHYTTARAEPISELTVKRRGLFEVRQLAIGERVPDGWKGAEWPGLSWAYRIKPTTAEKAFKRSETMATSNEICVGARVVCTTDATLGVGTVTTVTSTKNFGEVVFVRWGDDAGTFGHARGELAIAAPGAPKTMASVKEELGEWKQDGDGGWARDGVVTIERGPSGVWHRTDVDHGWASYTCPDAAREAADAYLVSQGRLPASRAFVRLGEWEPDTEHGHGYMVRRQTGGQSPLSYWACREVDRAESDARAVANGWLDPSRAFKAPTSIHSAVALAPPPRAHAMTARAAMKETEEAFRKAVTHAINQPAKPTWGEWERHATDPVYNRFASGRSMWALSGLWNLMNGEAGGYATDIDDAREKADAYLVARGELEAERAFKRVGDWGDDRGVPYRVGGTINVKVWRSTWEVWTTGGDTRLAIGSSGGAAGKAAADAELVRRGLLAEERAFKVASAVCVDSAQGGDYGGVVQISKKATGVFEVVASHALPVSLKAHTVSVALGADGLCSVDCTAPHPCMVQCLGNGRENSYRILDAYGASHPVSPGDRLVYRSGITGTGFVTKGATKEVAISGLMPTAAGKELDRAAAKLLNLRRNGEETDEAFRARCMDRLRGSLRGTWQDASPWPANPAPIPPAPITIANWEHHLPALLDGAPREFRDGFNRRQGPAWEAYLRALAWVKEQIQCRMGPIAANNAIPVAVGKAYGYLGAEWVKANVR